MHAGTLLQVQVFPGAHVTGKQASPCRKNTAANTFLGKQNLYTVTKHPPVNNMNVLINASFPPNQNLVEQKIDCEILLAFQHPHGKDDSAQQGRLVGCLK